MAWTALTFAYGSKLTAAKMTQIFDNFTAMGSGSPSAPKVSRLAMEPFVPGSYRVVDGGIGGTCSSYGSYQKLSEVVVPRSGALRIAFSMMKFTPAGTVYGRIYRNGSAVGTARSTTSSNYQEYIQDISSWSPGDLLQIYGYATTEGDIGGNHMGGAISNAWVGINNPLEFVNASGSII